MINSGKSFEKQFKDSILDDIYYLRLKDSAQSFDKTSSLRFSSKNPYDCQLYKYPKLYCFELKSTKNISMSFCLEDCKRNKNVMIKKHQIEGLRKAAKIYGIVAGFILNWRKTNNTYFFNINNFDKMIKEIGKKSFNESDVINNNGILVEQKLLKVNYKYNILDLLNKI